MLQIVSQQPPHLIPSGQVRRFLFVVRLGRSFSRLKPNHPSCEIPDLIVQPVRPAPGELYRLHIGTSTKESVLDHLSAQREADHGVGSRRHLERLRLSQAIAGSTRRAETDRFTFGRSGALR